MRYFIYFVAALTICLSMSVAEAQNKVVVVPLGGAPGNATADDVVKGKTFSSSVAGKGAIGTLEYTEFCEGKEAGAEAFKLDISSYAGLFVGDIYKTDTGKLVEIVGAYSSYCLEIAVRDRAKIT